MFDVVLCQRDFKEINALRDIPFIVEEFRSDSQLKELLALGKKVLFITTKSSVIPDLLNLYNLNEEGKCEYYYLSRLNENLEELEACEKFFPGVNDISTCADYYSASGVFFLSEVDPVGMPNFGRSIMPVCQQYHDFTSYKEALFLDRDGILNVDHSYVHKKEDLELVSGAFEFLTDDFNKARLKIVLTNQSGVSKDMFEYEDVNKFNAFLNESLKMLIDGFYIAPFEFTNGVGQYKFHSLLRKPLPGMLLEACYDFPINISKSYMVGDKASDSLEMQLLETIHLKGKYDLSNCDKVARDFMEVLNLAKALPNSSR